MLLLCCSGTQALEDALDEAKRMIAADGLNVVEEPIMIPKWVRDLYVQRTVSKGQKITHSYLSLG